MTEPLSQSDPLKAAWLSQPLEQIPMTALELTTAATGFERKVRRRNLLEYVAGAVVIPIVGGLALFGHFGWIMRAGFVLAILGVAFVLWQLHRQASPSRTPDSGTPESLLAFQRAELVRQRDALKRVPVWYLLPLVPSFIALDLGRWFQDHNSKLPLAEDHGRIIVGSVISALIFAIVWLLNALVAAKLDRHIDRIDRLSHE